MKLEQLEHLHSEIPPAAPWLPILVIHIRSQVKRRQSQSYKLKKIAKNSNVEILQEIIHVTHLLDKMYNSEMDPSRTVGATERTRDAGGTDGVKPIYPPTTLLWRGYNECLSFKQVAVTWLIKDRGTRIVLTIMVAMVTCSIEYQSKTRNSTAKAMELLLYLCPSNPLNSITHCETV